MFQNLKFVEEGSPRETENGRADDIPKGCHDKAKLEQRHGDRHAG